MMQAYYATAFFLCTREWNLQDFIINENGIELFVIIDYFLICLPSRPLDLTAHGFIGIVIKESHEFCIVSVLTDVTAKQFIVWSEDSRMQSYAKPAFYDTNLARDEGLHRHHRKDLVGSSRKKLQTWSQVAGHRWLVRSARRSLDRQS
jgi:hypothetical protein